MPKAQPPEKKPEPPVVEIPLRDDPYAPVIYVTELAGGGKQGENYNLTFAVMLYDHGDGQTRAYRKTNLRLVIPTAAVPTAINFLQQLQNAEKEALSPVKDRTIQ
jgi:hypothetical protein